MEQIFLKYETKGKKMNEYRKRRKEKKSEENKLMRK